MDEAKIKERIAELTRERDELVLQANARISFLNGKIEGLSELLNGSGQKKEPAGGEGDEVKE